MSGVVDRTEEPLSQRACKLLGARRSSMAPTWVADALNVPWRQAKAALDDLVLLGVAETTHRGGRYRLKESQR